MFERGMMIQDTLRATAAAGAIVMAASCGVAEAQEGWQAGDQASYELRAGARVDGDASDNGWGDEPCATTTRVSTVTPSRSKPLTGGRLLVEIPKGQVPLDHPATCPTDFVYANFK